MADRESTDLLVVGAGPTGIALGAAAQDHDLTAVLVDRGSLVANLLDFPTYMTFFTTRDLLEIAGVPFAVPHDKPSRQEALTYYRAVAATRGLQVAQHEEVVAVRPIGDGFEVTSRTIAGERRRQCRAVALATGYFHRPKRLGVPGEDLAWVNTRYREPYRHFGETVAVIGGGNSAAEAALDFWRNGVDVRLIHRGDTVKRTVKYWVKPDLENRIAEGSITAFLETRVTAFGEAGIELEGPAGRTILAVDAAYVLIGYEPDIELERVCGVEVDPGTMVPVFDPETCESNVPGLYIAGTLQAGRDLGKIFIENSRQHAPRIARHLAARLAAARGS